MRLRHHNSWAARCGGPSSLGRWLAALTLLSTVLVPRPSRGQVPDSVAHPIGTSCGVRLDPVGYVLGRTQALKLSTAQISDLEIMERELRAKNRPLGEKWWALHKAGNDVAAAREEVLVQLKANYQVVMERMKAVLTGEQWREALRPSRKEVDPRVRCLARSVLVILGTGQPGP